MSVHSHDLIVVLDVSLECFWKEVVDITTKKLIKLTKSQGVRFPRDDVEYGANDTRPKSNGDAPDDLDSKLFSAIFTSVKDTSILFKECNDNDSKNPACSMHMESLKWVINFGPVAESNGKTVCE